jgi:hypothetical protein
MKKYINRNADNLTTMTAIVSICNAISKDTNSSYEHNLLSVERDYPRYIKIIMLSREIYCNYLSEFLTVGRMAEYYNVSLNSLNRILKLGKHSLNKHNYILKYYGATL